MQTQAVTHLQFDLRYHASALGFFFRAVTKVMISQRLKEQIGLKQLIGESSLFRAEIKKIPVIAQCDESVLISGETGTGKELCARAIHYLSTRSEKPFIPVNCGAIPVELLENELFGHARGAFTGAFSSQSGLLREADGGTLFLDEIDWLPQLAQVKLLRFLQEKEYRALGSSKTRIANVRVIAASNMDFEEAVAVGKLRRDLYYRLDVITIALPPLRARREDIPLLVHHFFKKYAVEFHKAVKKIHDDAMLMLTLHDWPGNVRELDHLIKRAVILSENELIESADLNLPGNEVARAETFQQAKAKVVKQFEKNYIRNLLLTHRGNITRAAQAAHKNRRAFWQLIRKHNINAASFRF